MTAEVVELRSMSGPGFTTKIRVGDVGTRARWLSMDEAREVSAALHRYDLAKEHEADNG